LPTNNGDAMKKKLRKKKNCLKPLQRPDNGPQGTSALTRRGEESLEDKCRDSKRGGDGRTKSLQISLNTQRRGSMVWGTTFENLVLPVEATKDALVEEKKGISRKKKPVSAVYPGRRKK